MPNKPRCGRRDKTQNSRRDLLKQMKGKVRKSRDRDNIKQINEIMD